MNTPRSIRCNPKSTFRFEFCSLTCAIFHVSLCLVSILFDLVASLLNQLLSVQRLRTTGYIAVILLMHLSRYSQGSQQMILWVTLPRKREALLPETFSLHIDWDPRDTVWLLGQQNMSWFICSLIGFKCICSSVL